MRRRAIKLLIRENGTPSLKNKGQDGLVRHSRPNVLQQLNVQLESRKLFNEVGFGNGCHSRNRSAASDFEFILLKSRMTQIWNRGENDHQNQGITGGQTHGEVPLSKCSLA